MKIRIKVRLADGTYEYRWVDVGQNPGGGSLPAITDADEGKVLRVKGGKAAWVSDSDINVHADFFVITREGLLALKPEYRGANTRTGYPYADSDNGSGVAGSKNAELPEHLVIPETVNGTAVNRLADGIFLYNTAVKNVTFPSCVEDIPERCFDNCFNLHNLYNTDHVKSVGKTAFQSSSIYRVEFPNLETFGGVSTFQNCGRLVYADIGGVTSLPDKTFNSCVSLSRVKSQKKITSVGEKAFSITGNLMNLDFVSNLTNIGSAAFLSTRFEYDWNSLTGCTFGTDATQKQFNPTDFWSTCTYTACENPLPTQLTQDNPLWAKREIGSSGVTYAEGCGFFSIMHAYCGLHDISAESVEELENIVNTNYPGHLDTYTTLVNNAKFFAQGLGLTTETYKQFDQTVLQTVYDALANGKYALVGLVGTSYSLSHFVLIYGINDYGELLVIDSAVRYKDDMSKAAHLTIPYKNLCGYKHGTVDLVTIISL